MSSAKVKRPAASKSKAATQNDEGSQQQQQQQSHQPAQQPQHQVQQGQSANQFMNMPAAGQQPGQPGQQPNPLNGLTSAAAQYYPVQQVPQQQYGNNFLPPPAPMGMQQQYYIPFYPNPYFNGAPQQQQLSQQRFAAPPVQGTGASANANANAGAKLPHFPTGTQGYYKQQTGQQPTSQQGQVPNTGDFNSLQGISANPNFMVEPTSMGSSKSPVPVTLEGGAQVLKTNPHHGGAITSNYRRAIQPTDPENDAKPYRCSQCDWAFVRHSDLRRHQRSHGSPEYHCPYWHPEYATCPHRNQGSFNRLDVLKRHLRLVHFDPEDQDDSGDSLVRRQDAGKCLSCSKHFVNSKSFIDHVDECALNTPMEQWKYKKNGMVTNVKKDGSDDFAGAEDSMDASQASMGYHGVPSEVKREPILSSNLRRNDSAMHSSQEPSQSKLSNLDNKRSADVAGLSSASNSSAPSSAGTGADSSSQLAYLKRPRGRPRKYLPSGAN